jgi:hypothetical protein
MLQPFIGLDVLTQHYSRPHVPLPSCISVLPLPQHRVSLPILDSYPPLTECESPPRGRFSHLSMFRLGSALFIPGYLTVTLFRVFASPEDDGNFVLMAALAASA